MLIMRFFSCAEKFKIVPDLVIGEYYKKNIKLNFLIANLKTFLMTILK